MMAAFHFCGTAPTDISWVKAVDNTSAKRAASFFLEPTRVHTPNGISIGSAVFCTAHGRRSLCFTMGRPFPLKIAVVNGDMNPRLILAWAHPTEHPKRHLDRFNHICSAHGRQSLYFIMGRPFPLKIAPSHGASAPLSNTWFLKPTRVHNPNGISIGSAVFVRLMIVIYRQTETPR